MASKEMPHERMSEWESAEQEDDSIMDFAEVDFWQDSLGAWLKDCCIGPKAIVDEKFWRLPNRRNLEIQYKEICDGLLLTLLYKEIDPKNVSLMVVGDIDSTRDFSTKQRIFFSLLEAIRKFYKQRLNQLVVLAPPDIVSIVRCITPDESGEELKKFLLLLLGCAVQGDRKKEFIERITRLGPDTQKGIVHHIQKITEGTTVVLPLSTSTLNSLTIDPKEVALHLERVMKERDNLAHQLLHMTPDNESDEGSSTTATSSLNGDLPPRRTSEIRFERRSPSPTAFDRHSNVELASVKAELRKLRNLAEEKDEELNDLRDELDAKESELLRIQEERLELIKDARAAKDLRDELDCIQHKLMKLEKLEQENSKLREKIAELDYYRSRTEQLLSENDALEKTMNMLEDEVDGARIKCKNQQDVENRLEESQKNVRNLQADISEKNSKIEQLLLEQSRLENELNLHNSKIAEMERFNDPGSPRESFGSLADQLNQSDRGESVKLRLEIRRLRAQLEDQKDISTISVSSVDMEPINQRITEKCQKIEELKEENSMITEQLHELEKTLSAINNDYKETSATLESVRNERDEAVKSLHEARRKFTQFQTEFGRKFEQESEFKIREIEVELQEQKLKYSSAVEEHTEAEKQLEKLREEQRSLRKTVDDLKEEKHKCDLQTSQLERSLKNSENEKNALKERTEKLEDELEVIRMRMLTTDDAAKRLEVSERLLVEQQNRVGDVESENRSLQQQIELESKKTQRLREDLIAEKARLAEIIGRLRSLCAAIQLHGGKLETSEMSDEKLIDNIDEVLMGALSAAKREADALRLQQHTQIAELTDLRRDIEKLRRSESASLSESDDRVRELSKENVSMKEQIFLLQEKVREQQIEISSKNSQVIVAKREIEELNRNATNATATNTELARLQVSLRNLQLQEELQKQDNGDLRCQLETAEKSRQLAKKDADSLATMHQALLGDHDRLQNLHDLLTHDYERTKQENQDMKVRMRNQRSVPVVIPTRELDELRTILAQERAAKDKQLRAYADLHNEHGAVKRELDMLKKEKDSSSRSSDSLNIEIRNLRINEQASRTTIKELSVTVDDLSKSLQNKDIEISKLHNRVEMLTQLNRTYDEESKNLARQVEMLLQQNKELLHRALNDKDMYHQEQKESQERLVALRRHKEKLEEKIMDQYRSMENKRFPERKQALVKRAAKALINRRRPSQPSSNGSTTEDSSNYSADEASNNANGVDDLDIFPPTCSSSDDVDRTSPRYEVITTTKDSPGFPSFNPALRNRNDIIGGSVRVYSNNRRPIVSSGSLERNGSERPVDVPSYLPPRAPVRNSSVTASLRARPPPPPYPKTKPPPPYQRCSTPNDNCATPVESSPVFFAPKCSSTPKSKNAEDRLVVGEGEKRDFVREKEERVDKAMSIYENVNSTEAKATPAESTVWPSTFSPCPHPHRRLTPLQRKT
ncbi:unnamed protein product [Auanema sp. JU1783]|nr:unnamed protein product [Auanema sp. JU1783]